jgi:hypothetical protein
MKQYIEILSLEDSHCSYRMDVTGKNDSQIDKISVGIMNRMNLENYYLDNRCSTRVLETGVLVGN